MDTSGSCFLWARNVAILFHELEKILGVENIIEDIKIMRVKDVLQHWLAIKFKGSNEWYAFDRTVYQIAGEGPLEYNNQKIEHIFGIFEPLSSARRWMPYYSDEESFEVLGAEGSVGEREGVKDDRLKDVIGRFRERIMMLNGTMPESSITKTNSEEAVSLEQFIFSDEFKGETLLDLSKGVHDVVTVDSKKRNLVSIVNPEMIRDIWDIVEKEQLEVDWMIPMHMYTFNEIVIVTKKESPEDEARIDEILVKLDDPEGVERLGYLSLVKFDVGGTGSDYDVQYRKKEYIRAAILNLMGAGKFQELISVVENLEEEEVSFELADDGWRKQDDVDPAMVKNQRMVIVRSQREKEESQSGRFTSIIIPNIDSEDVEVSDVVNVSDVFDVNNLEEAAMFVDKAGEKVSDGGVLLVSNRTSVGVESKYRAMRVLDVYGKSNNDMIYVGSRLVLENGFVSLKENDFADYLEEAEDIVYSQGQNEKRRFFPYEATDDDDAMSNVNEVVAGDKVGGINLDPSGLVVEEHGENIEFEIPEEFRDFEAADINGFSPVILNVIPVTNLPLLLGINDVEGEDPLDSAKSIPKSQQEREEVLVYLDKSYQKRSKSIYN